jgi:hypothetical protein
VQGEPYQLCSGIVVLLKPVDIVDLAITGEIPAPLLGAASDAAQGMPVMQSVQENREIVTLVARACLVGAHEAPEGEPPLTVEELSGTDRLDIFNWSTRQGGSFRPFRPEQEAPAAD